MSEPSGAGRQVDPAVGVKRRRAARACLSCRMRKVRCDVSRSGPPCMNCSLDSIDCVVKARKSNLLCTPYEQRVCVTYAKNKDSLLANNWLSASSIQETEADCLDLPLPKRSHRSHPNSVVYTYYSFLTLDNLPNCLSRDVDFLEAEGCFHLPTRAIMDQILQQYFLHIHPFLPLFNEGDFWEMYYDTPCGRQDAKMSLLVLQAIIFVSCNFVNWSMESVSAFGYKSIRGLRAAFYRRAKLLYDFGAESAAVPVSQTALLLSYWTPPVRTETKPNSVWLSIAIQNAKNASAPYYATLSPSQAGSSANNIAEAKRINILKRLWWCCIIRDRILPLGLRRGIQITRAHFDFEKHPPLGLMDLDDEIHRSAVYTPDAKRELIRIFSRVLDLCVILTDVLVLVFPLDGALDQFQRRPSLLPSEEGEIRKSKNALVHWYTAAVTASTGAEECGGQISSTKHESVALHTHLMYTYYHSARMALYNHELQHYLALTAANPSEDTGRLLDTRDAIQNAFSNITEILRGLNQRHLIRWLPISAAAYIAFPLALQVLNTHLSAARQAPNHATLIEVIKVLHIQYDGVDWIARLVRYLVDLVQADPAFANGENVTDWAELLAVKPESYLRFSLALDLSMNSGRFPDKNEFLTSVDETKTSRSGRLEGSIPEPGQSLKIQEENPTLLAETATMVDTSRAVDMSSPNNQRTASVTATRSEAVENSDMLDERVEEQVSEILARVESPCPPSEPNAKTDGNLLSPLPDDLDEFLDHTMGEATASEDSFGGIEFAGRGE
ncbi:hypothetical protein M406DRAFT_248577 [Cryphonectria parasitica EP155]|uniref:Zn(2)-C6 fungal-type domain-containing protein n=1 Tax=Cryphonectria parasitica (strain ATCC 38755 / EP155) TaxID=660469 RepID=A0A9P4YEF5_CRYP1|nr:uncharacterized protein M406DRAFT_248577 [Cryphonectria parasitica EP155]KAF3771370.1 hypothetical protein M406DRAFT_248577 [Cryphonectria parasitica EP155]